MDWLIGSKNGEARKLVAQLNDAGRAARAAAELQHMGAGAIPALLEGLQAREASIVETVSEILICLGPQAIPALSSVLQQAHPLSRARAALILGRIGDISAIPVLMDALQGEFYTVRAASASALGEIGHSRALEPLLKALKDTEPQVRMAAAGATGKLGKPACFDDLANLLLDDPDLEVRQAAARALGAARHPEALSFLIQAMGDSFWWYEREAGVQPLLESIQGMGSLAVLPLIEALNNPEGTVRRYAAAILGKLGDRRAIPALGMALYDMHHEVGTAAALSLSAFGADSLDALDEAASHPEAGIRENVALALAGIDHPRATTILLDLLGDLDRSVIRQALSSLGAQSDPRAREALGKRAADRSDRELQAVAKEVVGKMRN